MKAFNEKLIEEIRANNGQIVNGPLAGSKPMILTTVGARSHQPRSVVIGYRSSGDRFLSIASNNGADIAPQWYANLMKDPLVTVEVGGEKYEVRARVATPSERGEMAKLIDYLERQQALTSREIPIVIFERT